MVLFSKKAETSLLKKGRKISREVGQKEPIQDTMTINYIVWHRGLVFISRSQFGRLEIRHILGWVTCNEEECSIIPVEYFYKNCKEIFVKMYTPNVASFFFSFFFSVCAQQAIFCFDMKQVSIIWTDWMHMNIPITLRSHKDQAELFLQYTLQTKHNQHWDCFAKVFEKGKQSQLQKSRA